MKFLTKRKDGGGESTVTGYWLVEIKSLFSIAVLKFEGKSREAFHNHAFNCFSWVLRGELREQHLDGRVYTYRRSWLPFVTRRSDFHKVDSYGTSLILTFRGPWAKTWNEFRPIEERPGAGRFFTLTNGRIEL